MRRPALVVTAALIAMLLVSPTPALAVTEVDQPGCRWSHYYGSGNTTWVSYMWGDRLQTPGSLWRNAFEASLSDWNSTATLLRYDYDSYGDVYINTYSMDDGAAGYAQPYCNGSTTHAYDVLGNIYYDNYSDNHRRSVTGHELGHGWSLGHISDPGTALLGNNPDPNVYYTPQQLDIDLVNQVYY